MTGISNPPGLRARQGMNMLLAAFRRNNTPRPGNIIGRESGSYREICHLYLRALEREGLVRCLPNPKHAGAYLWQATAEGLAAEMDSDTAARLAADMPAHLRHYDAQALLSAFGMPLSPPPLRASHAARTVIVK